MDFKTFTARRKAFLALTEEEIARIEKLSNEDQNIKIGDLAEKSRCKYRCYFRILGSSKNYEGVGVEKIEKWVSVLKERSIDVSQV